MIKIIIKIIKNIFLQFVIFFFLLTKIATSQVEKNKKSSFEAVFNKKQEILLETKEGFYLSTRPLIKMVDNKKNFIILDNFNVRQILVFDNKGKAITKMGGEGKGPGEYLYPKDIVYHKENFYVLDSDLRRISIFDKDYKYLKSFLIPINISRIAISNNNELFCYSDGFTGYSKSNHIIFKMDWSGNILYSFMNQSKNYSIYSPSEGGGLIINEESLYAITPYEYKIQQFNLNGKLKRERVKKENYVPPPKIKNKMDLMTFNQIVKYHKSWSHIAQIIVFRDMLGVLYTEPPCDGHRNFLDLYDFDLNLIYKILELPELINLAAIKSELYILIPISIPETNINEIPNPKIIKFELISR